MTPSFAGLHRLVNVLLAITVIAFFIGIILFSSGVGSYSGAWMATIGGILLSIAGITLIVGLVAQAIYLGTKGIAETIEAQSIESPQ